MKKILGILGGMGPGAAIGFQKQILHLTAANCDQEHLHVITNNNPHIPNRIHAISAGKEAVGAVCDALQDSLDLLINAGATCIAMPCVTAHYFKPYLTCPAHVTFLDAIEIVTKVCKTLYPDKVAGLLSSNGTNNSGILKKAFTAENLKHISPDEVISQRKLMNLISGIKSGEDPAKMGRELCCIAEKMQEAGADYFVLGCTELPIMVTHSDFFFPYVDAALELAKAAVDHFSN